MKTYFIKTGPYSYSIYAESLFLGKEDRLDFYVNGNLYASFREWDFFYEEKEDHTDA